MKRRYLTKQQQRKLADAKRRSAHLYGERPIIVKDENGTRLVNGDEYPAHLRRIYGVSNKDGSARQRPHRAPQGGILKGGQRGNGASHNGIFTGHGAGKKLTEGW